MNATDSKNPDQNPIVSEISENHEGDLAAVKAEDLSSKASSSTPPDAVAGIAPAVELLQADEASSSAAKPEKKARAPRKAKASDPESPQAAKVPKVAKPKAPDASASSGDAVAPQAPAAAPAPAQSHAPANIPVAPMEAPMPTVEQVQKAMAKAWRMQFQDECPEQAERGRQNAEGRRLAQAEGFAPLKHVDERELQIRAGQSMAAQESRQARAPAARPTPQNRGEAAKPAGQAAGAKKSRGRNRNRKNRPSSPGA